MKRPGLTFDPLHFISNEASAFQPIVAVRYTILSNTITRMMTSKSSTMIAPWHWGDLMKPPSWIRFTASEVQSVLFDSSSPCVTAQSIKIYAAIGKGFGLLIQLCINQWGIFAEADRHEYSATWIRCGLKFTARCKDNLRWHEWKIWEPILD